MRAKLEIAARLVFVSSLLIFHRSDSRSDPDFLIARAEQTKALPAEIKAKAGTWVSWQFLEEMYGKLTEEDFGKIRKVALDCTTVWCIIPAEDRNELAKELSLKFVRFPMEESGNREFMPADDARILELLEKSPTESIANTAESPALSSLDWPVPDSPDNFNFFGPHHKGVDLGGELGDPVKAADGGVVLGKFGPECDTCGYGNYVIINHGHGIFTLYAHLSEISVGVGQSIEKGDVIGKLGSTGKSTGPHLHFSVLEKGTDEKFYFINPLVRLP